MRQAKQAQQARTSCPRVGLYTCTSFRVNLPRRSCSGAPGLIKRIVYLFIVVLVLGAAYAVSQTMLNGSSSDVPKPGSKGGSPKVLVQAVQLKSTAGSFRAIATAWAEKSAEVYAVVDEKVTQVYFRPQQKVKRGELLIQQDDREEQLALRLAQVIQ